MRRFFYSCLGLLGLIFNIGAGEAAELKMNDLVPGTGDLAVNEKVVEVHYSGWLMDGTKFDSSIDRAEPFRFTLGAHQVIQGWDQGVLGMKVGGKRELIIPPEMAYGAKGAGGVIPPNATLRFEVQLLSVMSLPYQNIDNSELKSLLIEGVTLVDIRTEKEWKETGVIEGSKLLSFKMSNGQINPKFVEDMARIAGPKDKVILVCRSGNRSSAASALLSTRFGYEGIYNVRSGITYWMHEKNPTTKVNLENMKTTCSLC
jgi:rhodanese-related sulfurtransferase